MELKEINFSAPFSRKYLQKTNYNVLSIMPCSYVKMTDGVLMETGFPNIIE